MGNPEAMLKNYLKIAWRNLIRYKLYTFLHIVGLGLGIVCCLFIYLYIDFHYSFDNYHAKAKHTFRLVNELHLETTEYQKGASYAMYEALRSGIPGVDHATFLMSDQEFTIRVGEQLYKTGKRAALTSSEWFDLFDYHWLRGDSKHLDEPNTIVLTANVADRYFGKDDPIGKTIFVESKHPFRVVGIIDDSRRNTVLKSDMYLSLASLRTLQPDLWDGFFTDWGYINSHNNVFVSVKPESGKTAVEHILKDLTLKHFGPETANYFSFKLLPLSDTHFDTRYGGTVQKILLIVLAIIGGGIMIVACINYINMSVAQQARRSAEIGTRRVFGGSRSQLFMQFITESTIITLLALIFALILTWLLVPPANQHLFAKEPIQLLSWTRFWSFSPG